VERTEAEAIYDQGRGVVVKVLVELSAQNGRLAEQVERLTERVARQDERIAELERRLKRNSRNSSTPPSQDPPGAPERKRAPSAGRAQGGQPGHPGRGRPLLPTQAIDRVLEHWPERCRCCEREFALSERSPAGAPARHQVAELPEIAVELTEHRLSRLRCPGCGQLARAEPPGELPAGTFGPRLEAAVATLAVRNRLSRRDTVELVDELFGARISTGSVDALLRRTGAALEGGPTQTLSSICAARRRSTSTRPAGG
jgi:transposase